MRPRSNDLILFLHVTIVILNLSICHVSANREPDSVVVDDSEDWIPHDDSSHHAILAAHSDKSPEEELNSLLHQATDQHSKDLEVDIKPPEKPTAPPTIPLPKPEQPDQPEEHTPSAAGAPPSFNSQETAPGIALTTETPLQQTETTSPGSTAAAENFNSAQVEDKPDQTTVPSTEQPKKIADSEQPSHQSSTSTPDSSREEPVTEPSDVKESPAEDQDDNEVIGDDEESDDATTDPSENPPDEQDDSSTLPHSMGSTQVIPALDSSEPNGNTDVAPESSTKPGTESEVSGEGPQEHPKPSPPEKASRPTFMPRDKAGRVSRTEATSEAPRQPSITPDVPGETRSEEASTPTPNDRMKPGRLSGKFTEDRYFDEADDYEGGSFPGISITPNMMICSISAVCILVAVAFQFKKANDSSPIMAPPIQARKEQTAQAASVSPANNSSSVLLREQLMEITRQNHILKRKLKLSPLRAAINAIEVKDYDTQITIKSEQLSHYEKILKLSSENQKLQEKNMMVLYWHLKLIKNLIDINQIPMVLKFLEWQRLFETLRAKLFMTEVETEFLNEQIDMFRRLTNNFQEEHMSLTCRLNSESDRERKIEEDRAQVK